MTNSWHKIPGSGWGGSVLDLGGVTGFDTGQVFTPSVIKDGNIYKM